MSSLRRGFRCLRDTRPAGKAAAAQWQQPTSKASLAYRPKQPFNATRSITTSVPRSAEMTEIIPSDVESADQGRSAAVQVPYARAVPISPSYFSRKPIFNDAFVVVQDLARKYARLPIIPRDKVTPTAWRTKEQYRLAVGEHAKGRDYATCMKLAKRLNQIHPDLMPEEVKAGLLPFKREVNYYLNQPKIQPIDQYGRSHGVGKRKSSVARAWVVEGTGEVLVNGKPLSEAFGRVHDRESAVWGMKLTERLDKYNVWAMVSGGGTTGQAEALALAIAKALCVHEPALKNPLRRGKHSPYHAVDWTMRRKAHLHPILRGYEADSPLNSWMYHTRSKEGGKKEAWPRQGTQDAYLGQAIVGEITASKSFVAGDCYAQTLLGDLPGTTTPFRRWNVSASTAQCDSCSCLANQQSCGLVHNISSRASSNVYKLVAICSNLYPKNLSNQEWEMALAHSQLQTWI